jgi:hypothetical protein
MIGHKGAFTQSCKVLSRLFEQNGRLHPFSRHELVKYAQSKLVKQIKLATLLDSVNSRLGAVYMFPNLHTNQIAVRFHARFACLTYRDLIIHQTPIAAACKHISGKIYLKYNCETLLAANRITNRF